MYLLLMLLKMSCHFQPTQMSATILEKKNGCLPQSSREDDFVISQTSKSRQAFLWSELLE